MCDIHSIYIMYWFDGVYAVSYCVYENQQKPQHTSIAHVHIVRMIEYVCRDTRTVKQKPAGIVRAHSTYCTMMYYLLNHAYNVRQKSGAVVVVNNGAILLYFRSREK